MHSFKKKLLTCKIYKHFFLFLVGFGWLTTYIPRIYTYYVSTFLFAVFGLKMLRDGYYMSPNEGKEELEEVQSDLRKRDDEVSADILIIELP